MDNSKKPTPFPGLGRYGNGNSRGLKALQATQQNAVEAGTAKRQKIGGEAWKGAYTPPTLPAAVKTFQRRVGNGEGGAPAAASQPPVKYCEPQSDAGYRSRFQDKLDGKWSFFVSDDDDDFKAPPRSSGAPGAGAAPTFSFLDTLDEIRSPPAPSDLALYKPGSGAAAAAAQRSRPAGMINHGNTCYLNAVLQSLFSLPTFAADLQAAAALKSLGLPRAGVTAALAACLRDFQRTHASAFSPSRVRDALAAAAPRWRSGRQQDAHEFLCDLLDQAQAEVLAAEAPALLQQQQQQQQSAGAVVVAPQCRGEAEEATGPKPPSSSGPLRQPVSATACPSARNFSGCLVHTLTCGACGHASQVLEHFMHLSLQLPPPASALAAPGAPPLPPSAAPISLQRLLDDNFRPEQVDKACEGCGAASTPHLVEHAVWRLPRVLVVHLKRFQVQTDAGGYRLQKVHTAVEATQGLSLTWLRDPEAPPSALIAQAAAAAAQQQLKHGGGGGGASAGGAAVEDSQKENREPLAPNVVAASSAAAALPTVSALVADDDGDVVLLESDVDDVTPPACDKRLGLLPAAAAAAVAASAAVGATAATVEAQHAAAVDRAALTANRLSSSPSTPVGAATPRGAGSGVVVAQANSNNPFLRKGPPHPPAGASRFSSMAAQQQQQQQQQSSAKGSHMVPRAPTAAGRQPSAGGGAALSAKITSFFTAGSGMPTGQLTPPPAPGRPGKPGATANPVSTAAEDEEYQLQIALAESRAEFERSAAIAQQPQQSATGAAATDSAANALAAETAATGDADADLQRAIQLSVLEFEREAQSRKCMAEEVEVGGASAPTAPPVRDGADTLRVSQLFDYDEPPSAAPATAPVETGSAAATAQPAVAAAPVAAAAVAKPCALAPSSPRVQLVEDVEPSRSGRDADVVAVVTQASAPAAKSVKAGNGAVVASTGPAPAGVATGGGGVTSHSNSKGASSCDYRLHGIISHVGPSALAGHFVADIRAPQAPDSMPPPAAAAVWYHHDDSRVGTTTGARVTAAVASTAYLLFYTHAALTSS